MTFGSGKPGTPWLRMHWENFSLLAVSCACWRALGGALRGRSLWHFARAAWYAGALTDTPLTDTVCAFPSIRIPLSFKSGKLGTPLARMHLENASVELAALEPLPAGGLELVGELEPQAAIVVVAASAAAAASSRAGRCGCVWSCIWSFGRSYSCPLHGAGRSSTSYEQTAKSSRKIAVAASRVGDTVAMDAVCDRSGPVVLVVEDEPEIAGLMRDFLEANGFRVLLASDAEQATGALRLAPDCVLLDVMLPGASGFELCREIRASSELPILFLSARDGDAEKIRGLGLGADDYIVKSATPAEVVARVKAVLRRSGSGRGQRRLRFGRLEVDLAAHEVLLAGRPVRMTAREFELLRVLVEHPRQVFSREHLFELVWGSYGDRSAVSVYISRLREKLEDDPAAPRYIVTVWGAGYRFDAGLAHGLSG